MITIRMILNDLAKWLHLTFSLDWLLIQRHDRPLSYSKSIEWTSLIWFAWKMMYHYGLALRARSQVTQAGWRSYCSWFGDNSCHRLSPIIIKLTRELSISKFILFTLFKVLRKSCQLFIHFGRKKEFTQHKACYWRLQSHWNERVTLPFLIKENYRCCAPLPASITLLTSAKWSDTALPALRQAIFAFWMTSSKFRHCV